MSLGARLFLRLSVGLVVMTAALFVPAGTLKFWRGWIFLVMFFVPIIFFFLYFVKHDPQLIERRLQAKEKEPEQRLLIKLWAPLFLAAFVLPGLDYRFGWSRRWLGGVPLWLTILADVLVVGGWLCVFWVLKVNSFASRTIRVEAGQTVISDGPYGLVRHPMYLGSLMMWLPVPLALGSFIAWPVFLLHIPFYVFRLLNEEKVLRAELAGYSEYCQRTRWRLVPFVW
jgi:protein-S-isoprenylcysteine O-methyltransferase Ste14